MDPYGNVYTNCHQNPSQHFSNPLHNTGGIATVIEILKYVQSQPYSWAGDSSVDPHCEIGEQSL